MISRSVDSVVLEAVSPMAASAVAKSWLTEGTIFATAMLGRASIWSLKVVKGSDELDESMKPIELIAEVLMKISPYPVSTVANEQPSPKSPEMPVAPGRQSHR